ncbi:MAG TPA: class II fructose-bisphosphatase [Bacillales bacterium]|nr:class II fructose-bisphosphatase [Bacillales bacterium]
MQGLTMSLMNVTQKAAIASFPWIGKGEKNKADGASTEAMRNQLNRMDLNGMVVIGEGEMDQAPMLYIGEKLGNGNGPQLDIAVDPIDGTRLVAKGTGNAIAVIAASEKGSLLHAPDMYMKKIAVGPAAAGSVDIEAPLIENMKAVAEATGKDVSDLNIMIQDRKRHEDLIGQVQSVGASVKLFSDVDITGVIATAIDELEVDMLVGTGGAPEGVVAAVAMKCLGGDFQGKLVPQNPAEYDRCRQMGLTQPDIKLTLTDLVRSENCMFSATGITDGMLLKGVHQKGDGSLSAHSFTCDGSSHYHFVETIFKKSEKKPQFNR